MESLVIVESLNGGLVDMGTKVLKQELPHNQGHSCFYIVGFTVRRIPIKLLANMDIFRVYNCIHYRTREMSRIIRTGMPAACQLAMFNSKECATEQLPAVL